MVLSASVLFGPPDRSTSMLIIIQWKLHSHNSSQVEPGGCICETEWIYNLSSGKNHLFLPVLCLPSNLILASRLAFSLRPGSLKKSLLMTVLSRVISAEYGLEVVVVEHLDTGLELWHLGNLLLAHGCGHLTGIAVDTCDKSVAVRAVSRVTVKNIDDGTSDSFVPSVASRKDHHHLPRLHKLAHFDAVLPPPLLERVDRVFF